MWKQIITNFIIHSSNDSFINILYDKVNEYPISKTDEYEVLLFACKYKPKLAKKIIIRNSNIDNSIFSCNDIDKVINIANKYGNKKIEKLLTKINNGKNNKLNNPTFHKKKEFCDNNMYIVTKGGILNGQMINELCNSKPTVSSVATTNTCNINDDESSDMEIEEELEYYDDAPVDE